MGGLVVLAVAMASFFQALPALIITAPEPPPRPAAQPTAEPPSQPIWRTVERPYPAFELLLPEFTTAPAAYAIQRRPSDGARKDVLTWGDAAAPGPFAMVEMFRPGAAGEHFLDAASEITARIADNTVTDDVKPAGQIDSKFGPVPLVDFAIAAQPAPRRCLGFARAFDNPALQIAGWYCSAGEEIVDRATVACMLDRLTIVVADNALDAFFARAELKRTFCGQRSPILAATPEHEPGLAAPVRVSLKSLQLRGRLSTR